MVAGRTEVYFDPYDVGINEDPYPVYQRLREEAPAYSNERYGFWALSRHADVEAALVDWRTYTSTRSDILDVIRAGVELPPGVIMFEDPPLHTMHRGLMARVFTPRRMADLEDQIRAFCARALDAVVGRERFDIVAELGAVMPMRVIGMLLGIPEADQPSVRDRTDAQLRTRPGEPMEVRAEAITSAEMFADYIDWVTRRLSREEVLQYAAVIAGAGNETTGRLIGWLAKLLADHPDQRREVVGDRSLVPKVIDEALRFEPTGHAVARCTTVDVDLHGETIPAGSPVLMLVAAANRDPRRYERPDVFDIHRPDIQHLTFGFGIHYCLGASLARLEGRVALEELLTRFPEWDIDRDAMALAPTSTVRGWARMPLIVPS